MVKAQMSAIEMLRRDWPLFASGRCLTSSEDTWGQPDGRRGVGKSAGRRRPSVKTHSARGRAVWNTV